VGCVADKGLKPKEIKNMSGEPSATGAVASIFRYREGRNLDWGKKKRPYCGEKSVRAGPRGGRAVMPHPRKG